MLQKVIILHDIEKEFPLHPMSEQKNMSLINGFWICLTLRRYSPEIQHNSLQFKVISYICT